MKNIIRIVLFVAALAIGGELGAILLTDFEPVKTAIFAISCGVLGEALHQIDKKISEK